MAINWRQRAPVVRLLAAVYAELGEEAFKGRYGPIAKFFGREATYDAVKSFFAKEIVKMAEELKTAARNLDGNVGKEVRNVGRTARGVHRSGVHRRLKPLHLDLEDTTEDEIIITGAREVRMQMQGDEESSHLVRAGEERARSESLHDGIDCNLPSHGSRRTNAPASNTGHVFSATPGPSSRPGRQNQTPFGAGLGKQSAPSGKRPYSVFLDSDEMIPPSFGYVTDHGRHRCALCMTELPNAEVLEKHEAMSKLHLANLKNPLMVSNGCVMLAQGMSFGESTIHRRNQIDPAPPLKIGKSMGTDDGREQRFGPREEPSTPYPRAGSTVIENENQNEGTLDTIQVADSRHSREMVPIGGQDMNRPATHSRDGETGPLPDAEPFQHPVVDKGKQRAQTVPVDHRSQVSIAVKLQPNAAPESSNSQHQVLTKDLPDYSAGDTRSEDVPPTLLAQMLLSSGMELLAKKCIEEHPELGARFYNRVREMQRATGDGVAETREHARENQGE